MPGTLLPHEIARRAHRDGRPHPRRGPAARRRATSPSATTRRPGPTSSSTRSTRPSSAWSSGRRLLDEAALARPRHRPLPPGHRQAGAAGEPRPEAGPARARRVGADDEAPAARARVPARRLRLPAAKSVVRSHHERWDGSGYPSALIGEEISLFARIAAVADVFDAVTSERYHAPAVPPAEGVEIIRAGAGTAFDPRWSRPSSRDPPASRAGRAPRRRSSRRRSRGGGRRPRGRPTGRSGSRPSGVSGTAFTAARKPSAFGSPSSTVTIGAARLGREQLVEDLRRVVAEAGARAQRPVDQVGAREADHVGVRRRACRPRAAPPGSSRPCRPASRSGLPLARRSG